MNRKKVKQNKTSFTYAYLKDAAKEKQELLAKGTGCRKYAQIEAMLLSALAIEAYLNHLGNLIFKCWNSIERSLTPRQKLDLLCEKMSYEPDHGERPYQTFHDIFKFRQKTVHGKTEVIKDHESIQSYHNNEFPKEPKTDWENMISQDNTNRYVEDMQAIINDLWKHSGIKDNRYAPGKMGYFSWVAKHLPDD